MQIRDRGACKQARYEACAICRGGLILFPVDVLPVPDLDDFNQNDVIVDFVDDTIISNSNTVGVFTSRQFGRAGGAGVVCQLFDSLNDRWNLRFGDSL